MIVVGDASLGGAPETGAERVIPVGSGGLLVGRNAVADGERGAWRLSHRRASGRHALLQRAGARVVLEDLGSTNGTLCNGKLVRAMTPLNDGDLLFFGGHAAVYRLLSDDERMALAQAARDPLGPIATAVPMMAIAEQKLSRLARSEHEVLLVGETGVGKEVYAEALHRASGRAGAFVPVNCAALPGELVESELFGYVRGAHSQASGRKAGLIEEAVGGTLFLDELGDMPQAAQAKLLRFLQTREYLPLGATRPQRIDVRVLAATSRPHGGDGSAGLREDLVGRMGAAAFTLPPLRARREDIGALLGHFQGPTRRPLEPALFLALCLHAWPRNVRELKKVIETAALLAAESPELTLAHVPEEIAGLLTMGGEAATTPTGVPPVVVPSDATPKGDSFDLEPLRRRSPRPLPDKASLEALLEQHAGNVAEVARSLDRHWKVIKRAVDRYGIDPDRFRR